ncbi:winged helix-turn-helix domain-containing protein [Aeromonas sobria]|uniref:winged helix-turn-helix domain-containing protein n=1 Tax=Aeromonas sobria TaxID=646 RepID=UPI0011DF428C|nr:winged helix-turn-helix domain-containing protein [Aeromonas sobria]
MKDPALVTIKGVTVQLKNAEVLAAIIRTKGKKQIDLAKETGASTKTINAIVKRCREAGVIVDEPTRNVPVIGVSEYDGTEYRWDSVSDTEKTTFTPH